MINVLDQFHFLRPAWLLLPLLTIPLTIALYRQASSGANWRRAIAPELIDFLLEPGQAQRRHWVWLLSAAWIIAALAMAGPTWEKVPQPVLQKRDGLVIVLDLSLSMYAEDIQPSRLQRARYKILDILKRRREGLTGLVVYSADAHVVAPLTDDTATIANLVPALAPAMMPNFGSNAAGGIESAMQLLQNSGFERGRILLISDDIDEANSAAIASALANKQWQLAIVGVGTERGAPIPTPNGFLKSNSGSIAIAQLHRASFAALARKTSGVYTDLQLDDSDIAALLPDTRDANSTRTVQREFDQWRERGPQLVMLLLPLAAFAFRRGWLLVFLLLPLSAPSQAFELKDQWHNLWERPDQQAQRLFSEGNSKDAAKKFTDPAWRSAAQYRSGEYENAAQSLQSLQSPDAHYNRGNAFAQAGKLQDAIAAYEAALKLNPAMEDAKFNRELVKKQLEQQQQNNQSQQQKDNQQPDASSSQQKNGEGQRQTSDSQGSGEQADQQKKGDAADSKDAQDKDTAGSQQQKSDAKPNQSATEKKTANSEKSEAKAAKPDDQPAKGSDQTQSAQSDKNQDSKKMTAADNTESSEQQLQQRATEQWLRQIPDDPAGLLRRKFLYEYEQRQRNAPPRSDQPIW